MVRIGRLPSRRVEAQPTTTPVDMLAVSVGGLVTQARPYETAVDQVSGEQYPSKAVTSCPHCGHGIQFDIRQDQALSGVLLTASCDNCSAGVVEPQMPLDDPFRNPLIDGLVSRADIDPLYSDSSSIKTSTKDAAAKISSRRKKPASRDTVAPAAAESVADVVAQETVIGDALGGEDIQPSDQQLDSQFDDLIQTLENQEP